MYKRRHLEKIVKTINRQFPALLLTGPRQVGKTTLLKHLCGKNRTYLTLDDPALLSLAKEDPGMFLQRFEGSLLIDEIQYAPELLPYIKMQVDSNRKPGMFWLTGSQHFHLMKNVSESLAGRVGILNLLGFSQRELINGKKNDDPFLPDLKTINSRLKPAQPVSLMELYTRIWRGSFPVIALDNSIDHNLFYNSYVQTYLQRDVHDLSNVGNEQAFMRFLRVSAARTGQLLNYADLARDADIAPNTAKNWITILEASGVIYLLEPYHTNVTKRLVKAPKLYFLDTGLCAYLTQWTSPETLEVGAMTGAILETWIVGEIIKSYWNAGIQAPINFYRDKDKREIDLLIIKDNTVYPLEIKKSTNPQRDAVKHFSVLNKLNLKIGQGGVICLTDKVLPFDQKFNSIPVTAI